MEVEGMEKKVEETPKEPNYRGIKAMPYVIGNETFERLGVMGAMGNLLVYLTTMFNMKSITAINILNIFNGTCNFGTLPAAFLADTYFGRYNVIAFASVSTFLGMLMLTLTAAITKLHPSHCEGTHCNHPTPPQLTFLFTAFGLMTIGASGVRPCNLAFGADQFNPNTESGQAGLRSFFNWYYFTISFAVMVSFTVIIYVQSTINWAIGLAIPTSLMFLACVIFFIGTKIYVKVEPEGSPLTTILQVLVAAIRKRKLILPQEPAPTLFNHTSTKSINSKLPYSTQLRFIDKAAIFLPGDKINPDGSTGNKWRLCSMQQVEEVKCVIKTIPIWIAGIIYNISFHQVHTYTVLQALQSDRRLGPGKFKIPAASYGVFGMLTITIFVPIYDRVAVPFLQKLTKKTEGISLLQRIGTGLSLNILAMLVAGTIEAKRRDMAHSKPTIGFEPRKGAISSMSASWLILTLVVFGICEAFTFIGFIEFFYKQYPENMRSFAGSLVFCGLAIAGYLSSFLISVVHRTTREDDRRNWLAEDLNEAKLDYFYYLCAGLGVLNFIYFQVCAKWYKYKGTGNEPAKDMNPGKHII